MLKRFFEKGVSTYVCHDCRCRTRDTGRGEREVELCYRCYQEAQLLNAWSDGDISEKEYYAAIAALGER